MAIRMTCFLSKILESKFILYATYFGFIQSSFGGCRSTEWNNVIWQNFLCVEESVPKRIKEFVSIFARTIWNFLGMRICYKVQSKVRQYLFIQMTLIGWSSRIVGESNFRVWNYVFENEEKKFFNLEKWSVLSRGIKFVLFYPFADQKFLYLIVSGSKNWWFQVLTVALGEAI